MDLTCARIEQDDGSGPRCRQAHAVLVEEVGRRAQQVWPAAGGHGPVIALRDAATAVRAGGRWSAAEAQSFRGAEFAARPEGFCIHRDGDALIVTGNDARGVLYGVGWLLRHLEVRRSSVLLPDALLDGGPVRSAPHYPLRGHQIGYRPKTNSYCRLDRCRVGAVHPRAGDLRRQRRGSDSAGFRRCPRLRPLPAAADRHDAGGIRNRRPLRRRPVDLVSRPGVRLRRRCDGTPRPRRLARGVRRLAPDRRRVHSRRRSGIDAGAACCWHWRNGRRRRCATCIRGRRCGSLRRGSTATTRSTSTRRWKMGSTGWTG